MTVLSSIWNRIQSNLFPFLEEELGPLTEKQEKLVSILEIIRMEDSITYTYRTGRPSSDRKAIAPAFVAKAVYNFSTTRELLDRLKCDKALRRICSWESQYQIPKESTFSRAFAEFAGSKLLEEVHKALIHTFVGTSFGSYHGTVLKLSHARNRYSRKEQKERQNQNVREEGRKRARMFR